MRCHQFYFYLAPFSQTCSNQSIFSLFSAIRSKILQVQIFFLQIETQTAFSSLLLFFLPMDCRVLVEPQLSQTSDWIGSRNDNFFFKFRVFDLRGFFGDFYHFSGGNTTQLVKPQCRYSLLIMTPEQLNRVVGLIDRVGRDQALLLQQTLRL